MDNQKHKPMIPFQTAYEILLNQATSTGTEQIHLDQSVNRVLAEDVPADRDMPPFHKSAVDGYACIDPQRDQQLEVLETVAAGEQPTRKVERGHCSKVMTGAEVPPGTTHVVMVEEAERKQDGHIRLINPGKKTNIALKGEDFQRGGTVLPKGTWLRPQHLAILAAVGRTRPVVAKCPSVGLITTGNELVEPHHQPASGQIRNTNATQLMAQFNDLGLNPHYFGIVGDTEQSVGEAIQEAVDRHWLTVLTGGVSMGDHDYVPQMMEKAGIEILFHKIAMKPGKPTIVGRKGDRVIIGLPGNPVSTFLQFELLIKPLLYKQMGGHYRPPSVCLPLGEALKQKKSDRDSWKPVRVEQGEVFAIPYHGSGHIHALHLAEGFIRIPAGVQNIKKGATVDVRQV